MMCPFSRLFGPTQLFLCISREFAQLASSSLEAAFPNLSLTLKNALGPIYEGWKARCAPHVVADSNFNRAWYSRCFGGVLDHVWDEFRFAKKSAPKSFSNNPSLRASTVDIDTIAISLIMLCEGEHGLIGWHQKTVGEQNWTNGFTYCAAVAKSGPLFAANCTMSGLSSEEVYVILSMV
jgi:hypothetical protein